MSTPTSKSGIMYLERHASCSIFAADGRPRKIIFLFNYINKDDVFCAMLQTFHPCYRNNFFLCLQLCYEWTLFKSNFISNIIRSPRFHIKVMQTKDKLNKPYLIDLLFYKHDLYDEQ